VILTANQAPGGFNVEKILEFERDGVPVDAYGVGSSLFAGRFDFTADVVLKDGKPRSKVGREFRPNPRLEKVT
jgi:nicotinate phosphoribosyltransferase